MIGRLKIRTLLAPCVALALAACAGMQTVTDAPVDAGQARSFDASYERVKLATLDGVRDLKLEPSSVKEAPEGFVILIARTPHGMSYGEVGRIIVERTAQPPTTVHVRYERRFALQFQGSEDRFAQALFLKIGASLAANTVR